MPTPPFHLLQQTPDGPALSMSQLMRLAKATEQARNVFGGGGVGMNDVAGGIQVSNLTREGFWAKISSGSNPYAWQAVNQSSAGTWEDDTGKSGTTTINPAYELNGNTGVAANTRVWMMPAHSDSMVFITNSPGSGGVASSQSTMTVDYTITTSWGDTGLQITLPAGLSFMVMCEVIVKATLNIASAGPLPIIGKLTSAGSAVLNSEHFLAFIHVNNQEQHYVATTTDLLDSSHSSAQIKLQAKIDSTATYDSAKVLDGSVDIGYTRMTYLKLS